MHTDIDYTTVVPTQPPEELLPWMRGRGLLTGEAMVYESDHRADPLTEMRVRSVRVSCSGCGEVFHARYRAGQTGCYGQREQFGFYHPDTGESVKNWGESTCPRCGADTKVYHCGAVREDGCTLEHYWPVTVQVVDGLPVIIQWDVRRRVYWQHKRAVTADEAGPYEAYVYTGRKTVKLSAYNRVMGGFRPLHRWAQRQKCTDTLGRADLRMPLSPDGLAGTFAANCKLDRYLCRGDCCPVTYLRLYQQHPQIENLVVQHLDPLLNDLIWRNCRQTNGYYSCRRQPTTRLPEINWKEKKPARMLGLTKPELQAAIAYQWGGAELDFFRAAKDHGICPEEVALCMRYGADACLNWLAQGRPLMGDLRYLEKQKQKHPDPDRARLLTLKYFEDYLDMARELGDDLRDPSVRRPQHLIAAHDTASMRYTLRENAIEREKFIRSYRALQKFCWARDGLEIHPARSQAEMVREGTLLRHCVARYADSHADGTTAIFFIRRSVDPETPFFTLELDEQHLTVRQNRGKCNCPRTGEVRTFEEKWLTYIRHIQDIEKERQKHGTELPTHLPFH